MICWVVWCVPNLKYGSYVNKYPLGGDGGEGGNNEHATIASGMEAGLGCI